VFSSECPGWLCYALKKADPALIPLMSTIKTPMLIQHQVHNISNYHVAVMPCYDKKLEAVMDPGVDLVLTTTELLSLCTDLSTVPDTSVPCDFYSSVKHKSSSLGYAEFIFSQSVKDLYGVEANIEAKPTRRRDVWELEHEDLKFCIASGFQNIQNVIRDVKSGRCRYDYIEIMACPMGCLNGGGQPRVDRAEIQATETQTQAFFRPGVSENAGFSIERELKVVDSNRLKW
jgi:iron only hydrogenase large subunit-like protein